MDSVEMRRAAPEDQLAPISVSSVSQRTVRSLLWSAVAIEAFLLGLVAVCANGRVLQSPSPLARAWPVLLWPGRLVFGTDQVSAAGRPTSAWPELLLVAVLTGGASGAAALAVVYTRRFTQAGRRLLWLVLCIAAVLGLTLVILPSLPSDDVYSYILYGRISAVYGANPLISVPAHFSHDPFLLHVYWRDTRSVYGPVWLMLSGGISLLANALGGSAVAYVLLFKLLGLAAHLANAALIWLILGVIAPRRRLFGTVLYAWNPLCLLEFCASGHNDAVMLFFLLLGVYFLVRHWEVAALVAIGLSIATKYVPLALLPFYFAWVARTHWRMGVRWPRIAGDLAWRLGVVGAVMVVTALPYWSGPATLGSLFYSPPAQKLDNSLVEALKWPARAIAQAVGHVPYRQVILPVDTVLRISALVLFGLLWLWEFRRTRTLNGVLAAWGWALLWYVMIASGWFWPWYVTWLVAVVALLPYGRLTRVTVLLAAGVLTFYAFLPLVSLPVFGYRAGVAFGPALVYLLWLTWHDRLRLRSELVCTVGVLRARAAALVTRIAVTARQAR